MLLKKRISPNLLFHSSLVFCTRWIFFSNILQQFNIKGTSALSGTLYPLCSKIFLTAWVPAFKNHGNFSTFSTFFPSLDFNYLIKPLHNIHSSVYINVYLTGMWLSKEKQQWFHKVCVTATVGNELGFLPAFPCKLYISSQCVHEQSFYIYKYDHVKPAAVKKLPSI